MTSKKEGIIYVGTVRIIPYESGIMINDIDKNSYMNVDVYRMPTNVTLELTDHIKKQTIATITLDESNCAKLNVLIRRASRLEAKTE